LNKAAIKTLNLLQIQVVLQQQLATLLPLAKAGILTTDVHINATGSTGAELPFRKHILVGDQTICRITKLLNTNI
jgi:hypothetical protein